MTTEHQTAAAGGGPQPDGMLTVHVIGLPVALQARAQQQNDELVRELTLIAEGRRQQGAASELPARLVSLIDQVTAQYSPFTVEQEEQIADAVAAGDESVDLVYVLPPAAADAAQALGDLLDEADEFCREGKYLLTLATPPELVAYRTWFLSEFIEQSAGRPPVPWSEYRS